MSKRGKISAISLHEYYSNNDMSRPNVTCFRFDLICSRLFSVRFFSFFSSGCAKHQIRTQPRNTLTPLSPSATRCSHIPTRTSSLYFHGEERADRASCATEGYLSTFVTQQRNNQALCHPNRHLQNSKYHIRLQLQGEAVSHFFFRNCRN